MGKVAPEVVGWEWAATGQPESSNRPGGNPQRNCVMPAAEYWAIENYTYRRCPHPAREFNCAVSPHNHSCHSIESMGFLNQVVKLRFMRPFRGLLQDAFGLAEIADLNYADISYRSPLTVEDVFQTESASAAALG